MRILVTYAILRPLQFQCSQCSHGIHAHVDAQSAVVNQLLSNECFAFVQKVCLGRQRPTVTNCVQTAETCTCSARLTDHVPILNPYRTITRSLPPNTTQTAPAYGNEPEEQPRLGFPMYAGVGVTPVWSSSITLLPFSVSSVPLPPSSITNARPSSTNTVDPSPASVTSSSLQSPATPDPSPPVVQPGLACTPESNQQLVRYVERPHSSYRIRPYTRPASEG